MVFKTYLDSKGERDQLGICREPVWGVCTQPTVLSVEVFSWGKCKISWPFLPNTSTLLIGQLESPWAQPPHCVLAAENESDALNTVSTGALEGQVRVKLKLASMTKFHKSQNYGGAETWKWAEEVHKGKRYTGKEGQRQEAGPVGRQLRAVSGFLSPWTLAKLVSYFLN